MSKTMLAVVKERPEPGITVKHIPIPETPKGEVKVKVIYGSICGTDIGIYDWIPWVQGHLKPPIVIGHEIVGEIIDINGDASHLKIGDIVSSETHIYDETCEQCKMGNQHVCDTVQFFGYGRDGGFAEYATIPIRTTWRNDPSIPLKEMSVQEPLGNAVHAVTKGDVSDKRVLVVGLGPVGMCAVAVANAYGAREVVAIDPELYRRELTEKFTNVTTLEKIDTKDFNRFHVVIEASGVPAGIQTSLDAVYPAGKIVAIGIPKKEITLDWGKYIIDKEITIESIFGRRIWETWHQTTDLLKSRKIDLQKIITHEFELKDFEEAMKIMKSGKCGKILLKINPPQI
ncbi:hypothetical protein A3H80_04370 [Candidatus Roizmanbacteria bacterium RIFCSPLOWO2_02_FULL_37_19]|uniref:L-threonine 3-dehydrogenase n=1 Tax=Candidatus Roizmanbacteria bacterium RIFCSPHIGHO2_02_FULL_37_24 TaxID=1802037 RepID=A0A1F7GWH6_9BACT|nr:MAG: hypothetical protein A2862_04000 [Candidatus Roizmanbacteria bacterium RIFCSPHIGHO2_01_FULL_38_41]OGK23124.1 MAG: hypothetical protein A3C24_01400 [Candidatus Roizmanbacteria bacterium RIFCSPHIGHO2_02_FULL_37_24]OGK32847.1 MAG: hypothetical protein A3E10_00060 [Candidatus Roizmanbacteria bacterium RIFCSPHIGHO2_12_FULL_37_23]OGK45476.1 MAG: hypothetical protein A2956_00100 [Candidatus Roizmanbacteria bacterium RIFCSPLOWO2_01_FULL_37_57]OGK54260.1 MAG: hypothetical protein A3H80_04370 [Ca